MQVRKGPGVQVPWMAEANGDLRAGTVTAVAGRGASAWGRGELVVPGHSQQGWQPMGAAWGLALPQGGEREGQAEKRPEGV